MAVIAVDDWQERLRGRVYQQFKESNWAYPLADAIGAGSDSLELAFTAMLFLFSIDTITEDATSPLYGVGRGVQLDRIGRLVGQPRSGTDDEHYRYYLRARIRANKSSGTPEEIIAVFQAMLGATELPWYTPGGNASLSLRIVTPITDEVAEIARYFLGLAVMGGVKAILVSQELADAGMFNTGISCFNTSLIAIGDATIDVDDASNFPTSGTVVIDKGTVDEETIAYTSRNNTSLRLGGGGAVNNHDFYAAISLVGTGAPGKGFPTATYVNAPAVPTDTAFDVVDSSAFSTNDVIIVDEGTDVEETFTVTGTIIGAISVTPAIANAHATGAAIVIDGSGGELARAHEA